MEIIKTGSDPKNRVVNIEKIEGEEGKSIFIVSKSQTGFSFSTANLLQAKKIFKEQVLSSQNQ